MNASLRIQIPASVTGRMRDMDLSCFERMGFDPLLHGIVSAIAGFLENGYWTAKSTQTCLRTMKAEFMPWLATVAAMRSEEMDFNSIDRELLVAYIDHLKSAYSHTNAARIYAKTIGGLLACEEAGMIQDLASVRPARPFTTLVQRTKHAVPYSKEERARIVAVLNEDLRSIEIGNFDGSELEEVVVYFLSIQLRTGFNTTTLARIGRSALIDHPLREGYKLLVSFKERAKKDVHVPVKFSEAVEDSSVCRHDLASIYTRLTERTRHWCERMGNPDRAFIRPPVRAAAGKEGAPLEFTVTDASNAMRTRYAEHHGLIDDMGRPLRISGSRLRATLAERAFELSGGDPLVVSSVLGNSPRVASVSYMEPSVDSREQFSKSLEEFVVKLAKVPRGDEQKTPTGACDDPLGGRYAPKDGVTYCERWLNCFKCPNQCLSGDGEDLWRLFSFYWLLQRKSQLIRRTSLSAMFRFVIRVIDGPIMVKFGAMAEAARARARTTPHPFWALASDEEWFNVE